MGIDFELPDSNGAVEPHGKSRWFGLGISSTSESGATGIEVSHDMACDMWGFPFLVHVSRVSSGEPPHSVGTAGKSPAPNHPHGIYEGTASVTKKECRSASEHYAAGQRDMGREMKSLEQGGGFGRG